MGRPKLSDGICSISDCVTHIYARGWCEKHYRTWRRHGDPNAKLRGVSVADFEADTKRCSKCEVTKTIDGYHKSKSTHDGFYPYCKDCACAYRSQWAKDNPERVRATNRKNLYGITPEEYTNLMARQCGMCAVCQCWLADLPAKQVHIDHNHDTGKVRGVLCHSCNAMIGHARESIKHLYSAAYYLEMHN